MFSRVPITPNTDYYTETAATNASPLVTASPLTSESIGSSISDDLTLGLDWWSNAIEEDSFYSPLPFDASERGLWNGRFVPPPPRPPFWDDTITSDGLTTCDLCTWALHERNAFSLDGSISGKFFILITLKKKEEKKQIQSTKKRRRNQTMCVCVCVKKEKRKKKRKSSRDQLIAIFFSED